MIMKGRPNSSKARDMLSLIKKSLDQPDRVMELYRLIATYDMGTTIVTNARAKAPQYLKLVYLTLGGAFPLNASA